MKNSSRFKSNSYLWASLAYKSSAALSTATFLGVNFFAIALYVYYSFAIFLFSNHFCKNFYFFLSIFFYTMSYAEVFNSGLDPSLSYPPSLLAIALDI